MLGGLPASWPVQHCQADSMGKSKGVPHTINFAPDRELRVQAQAQEGSGSRSVALSRTCSEPQRQPHEQ